MGKYKIEIIEGENVKQAKENCYDYLIKIFKKKLKTDKEELDETES